MTRILLAKQDEVDNCFGITPEYPLFQKEIPISCVSDPENYLFSITQRSEYSSGTSYIVGTLSRFRSDGDILKQYKTNITNIGGSLLITEIPKPDYHNMHHIHFLSEFPKDYYNSLPENERITLSKIFN